MCGHGSWCIPQATTTNSVVVALRGGHLAGRNSGPFFSSYYRFWQQFQHSAVQYGIGSAEPVFNSICSTLYIL